MDTRDKDDSEDDDEPDGHDGLSMAVVATTTTTMRMMMMKSSLVGRYFHLGSFTARACDATLGRQPSLVSECLR
jgi:hypothetical protein